MGRRIWLLLSRASSLLWNCEQIQIWFLVLSFFNPISINKNNNTRSVTVLDAVMQTFGTPNLALFINNRIDRFLMMGPSLPLPSPFLPHPNSSFYHLFSPYFPYLFIIFRDDIRRINTTVYKLWLILTTTLIWFTTISY